MRSTRSISLNVPRGKQRTDSVTQPTIRPVRTLDDIGSSSRRLRERYHVDRLGICGSFIREEQTDERDLDLLVILTETHGLLDFVGLKQYLEDTLGLSVDLGMPDALKDGPAADNIRREVECL